MGEETENEVFVYVCRGISVWLLRDRRKKKTHSHSNTERFLLQFSVYIFCPNFNTIDSFLKFILLLLP